MACAKLPNQVRDRGAHGDKHFVGPFWLKYLMPCVETHLMQDNRCFQVDIVELLSVHSGSEHTLSSSVVDLSTPGSKIEGSKAVQLRQSGRC